MCKVTHINTGNHPNILVLSAVKLAVLWKKVMSHEVAGLYKICGNTG